LERSTITEEHDSWAARTPAQKTEQKHRESEKNVTIFFSLFHVLRQFLRRFWSTTKKIGDWVTALNLSFGQRFFASLSSFFGPHTTRDA
jgi:hypothetical protein